MTADYYKINCNFDKTPRGGETTKVGIRKTATSACYGIITGKVNNITVVDLDTYKWDTTKEHPWIAEFGVDYINKFNTYTVRTASGGYHLFFQYEEDLKTCIGAEMEIDIRGDSGYVIGVGSRVNYIKNSERKQGTYRHVRNTAVAKMPEELKLWLCKYVGAAKNKPIPDGVGVMANDLTFDLTYNEYLEVCQALIAKDDKYFGTRAWHDWTGMSSHCSDPQIKEAWNRYSQTTLGSYDYANNCRIWDKLRETPNVFFAKVMKVAGLESRIPYIQYKKFDDHKYANDITAITGSRVRIPEPRHITRAKLGYNFISEFYNSKHMVIKSDCGTGKTTAFAHFIAGNPTAFISITARQLLAHSQYDSFHDILTESFESSELPKVYDNGMPLKDGDSVVIQVDSLMKICDFDFTNYVIYLDEVASTIDYLVNSTTLANRRCYIFELFMKILCEAEAIIATDADIDYATHALFQSLNLPYDFIVNHHLNYAGTPTFEFESLEHLIDHVAPLPKWMIPTDSKKQAKKLYLMMEARGVACTLITSEYRGDCVLDNHERVIFSPKITFGLDSTMERGVYPCYVGKTLNPMHFVQQCCRSRNMTELGFLFVGKNSQWTKDKAAAGKDANAWRLLFGGVVSNTRFEDVECMMEYCKYVEKPELMVMNNYNKLEMTLLYNQLYRYYTYRNDALDSNKFKHFIKLITSRGFDYKTKYIGNKNQVAKLKDVREYDIAQFTPEDLNDDHKALNKILCIPNFQFVKYREYFINDAKRREHFEICAYFFGDKVRRQKHIADKADFNQMTITSSPVKIELFDNIITQLYRGSVHPESKIITLGELAVDIAPAYMQMIKETFKIRTAATTFKGTADGYAMLMNLSKKLFGKDMMTSEQTRVGADDRKRARVYKFDKELIRAEYVLYRLRHDDGGFDDE